MFKKILLFMAVAVGFNSASVFASEGEKILYEEMDNCIVEWNESDTETDDVIQTFRDYIFNCMNSNIDIINDNVDEYNVLAECVFVVSGNNGELPSDIMGGIYECKDEYYSRNDNSGRIFVQDIVKSYQDASRVCIKDIDDTDINTETEYFLIDIQFCIANQVFGNVSDEDKNNTEMRSLLSNTIVRVHEIYYNCVEINVSNRRFYNDSAELFNTLVDTCFRDRINPEFSIN